MLRTQQRLDLRSGQQQLRYLGHELLAQGPVTALGERGRMPDGIGGVEANKPTEQRVVVELLDKNPLGVNAVDRLQQQRASSCSQGPLEVCPSSSGVRRSAPVWCAGHVNIS
jgi:hypothetical protein